MKHFQKTKFRYNSVFLSGLGIALNECNNCRVIHNKGFQQRIKQYSYVNMATGKFQTCLLVSEVSPILELLLDSKISSWEIFNKQQAKEQHPMEGRRS